MSSTARGGKRSPADFYATPAWPVKRFLERVELPGGLWLEPAAGEGAIIKAVNAQRSDVWWQAVELRSKCSLKLQELTSNVLIGNFLKTVIAPQGGPLVSISNYPFSFAMEFIEHNLKLDIPFVIALLRLNFLGTADRNDFFKSNMPDVYVIPDRVSFAISVTCVKSKDRCGYAKIMALTARIPKKCPRCGGNLRVSTTDSIEYAWYVWGTERGRRTGKVEVLDHTPLEERQV